MMPASQNSSLWVITGLMRPDFLVHWPHRSVSISLFYFFSLHSRFWLAVFIYLLVTSCSMWDLSPLTMDKPTLSALGVHSLNHSTAREVPLLILYLNFQASPFSEIFCVVMQQDLFLVGFLFCTFFISAFLIYLDFCVSIYKDGKCSIFQKDGLIFVSSHIFFHEFKVLFCFVLFS